MGTITAVIGYIPITFCPMPAYLEKSTWFIVPKLNTLSGSYDVPFHIFVIHEQQDPATDSFWPQAYKAGLMLRTNASNCQEVPHPC